MNFKKKNICASIILLGLLVLVGCDIKENEIEPGLSFTKIYNSNDFNKVYSPLDVVQTSDSGYFVLAATESWTPYLLKTDQRGEFMWDQQLPEPFVNVLDNFYQLGGEVFIVCMDELNLSTYILRVNPEGGQPEVVFNSSEISYPLSASITPDGGWLIQSFEREARNTKITKLTTDYVIEWQEEFNIMEDKEEEVIKHLTRTGKRLPFFSGYARGEGNAGVYYFNGFNNFTVSFTFLNPEDGSPLGVVNGFRDLGYINAALPLSNGNFALAKNSYGENYLLPQATIDTRSISASTDLATNDFPEIDPQAPVLILNTQIINRDMSLFATHTKSKRIVIYGYDAEDGSLQDVLYLGQSAPYEIGKLKRTADGGLIVLGRTFVAGRFPRLCLFKLRREEVESMIL